MYSNEPQPGETLFDFLKRKKKLSIESSLNTSRLKENNSLNSNRNHSTKYEKVDSSPFDKKNLKDSFRETGGFGKTRDTSLTNSFRENSTTKTPNRTIFIENKSPRQTVRSSFIEMISPLRKKEEESTQYSMQTQHQLNKEKSSSKQTPIQESICFKNIQKEVKSLNYALEQFISTGQSLKKKSEVIFVEFRPLLKYLEENSSVEMKLKSQDFKLRLRSLEHLFGEFRCDKIEKNIEHFHECVVNNLESLGANVRSTIEKTEINSYRALADEKNKKICEIERTEKEYLREIDILNRKLEKYKRESEQNLIYSESLQEKEEAKINNEINKLQDKLDESFKKIESLSQTIEESKIKEKQLLKEIKDEKHFREETERRFVEETNRFKSDKEEYLLSEISIQKEEFKKDMLQLSLLHSNKEKELSDVIQTLKQQLSEQNRQKANDKLVESNLLCQITELKKLTDKIKKDNQILVTDIHRMNEEMYQHWLALKDIKTLATRLQIFGKFFKIYEDLQYNDQLFV